MNPKNMCLSMNRHTPTRSCCMEKRFLFIVLFSFPLVLLAQDTKPQERKIVQTVRANGSLIVDGFLDEEVWQGEGYSDFTQSDPDDGEKPTEKTTVWVAYDEEHLYVGARLYDSQPEEIMRLLGRRDDFLDSDWFIFAVDPYLDRRSGYQFALNPAGSMVDWTLYNDEWNDDTWDGIWEGRAQVDGEGWSVELKIPFTQLRFNKKDEYCWGVNFQRIIKRKNERLSFSWVPKEESGYVSRFADLIGINGIRPGRHIEFLPYTVGQAQFSPAEEGNPFQTGKKYLGNAGLDLKVGLKSNLTLDAAFYPDFGQVEVDPAVINLSAYETYYQEKRPFFIEGASIFNNFGRGGSNTSITISWGPPSFFYSRRIGRSPQGDVSREGYMNFPDRTAILGAFKVTGKVNGLNVGFISALTAREYAEVDAEGVRFKEEVEPLSYYGAMRMLKEFNDGAQGFGLLATSVIRNLSGGSLEDILMRRAFSLAFDGWTYLDKDRAWVLNGWFGGTLVHGSQVAIYDLQRSSLHYFQRPDATHVRLDEEATSLSGWSGKLSLNKQKGNLFLNASIGALSPGFDCNDIGFQFGGFDVVNGHLIFGYREPQPGKIFRRWEVVAGPFRNYDFGGNKTWDGVLAASFVQFLNYWGVDLLLAYNPKTMSNDLTRGGPLALLPAGYQVDFNLLGDDRKTVVMNVYTSTYKRPSEGYSFFGEISLKWKPRSNISLSLSPGMFLRQRDIQWVTSVDDPLMAATYGSRYVFGHLDMRRFYSEIRLNWTFTPKLTLQLYLQPFLAVGTYDEFKELARPESFDYNHYGDDPSTVDYRDEEYFVDPDGPGPAPEFSFENPDFNFKSLRGTVVLRWEYLPGSILYFVWTQNRSDDDNPGNFNFRRDISDLFKAPGDNIFLVKVSYRWNM